MPASREAGMTPFDLTAGPNLLPYRDLYIFYAHGSLSIHRIATQGVDARLVEGGLGRGLSLGQARLPIGAQHGCGRWGKLDLSCSTELNPLHTQAPTDLWHIRIDS